MSLARLFEVLCPLSLVVQALYLIARPRMNAPAWRFGIAFVLMLIFLSDAVWVKQFAYCRVLLPLTFSFNLLIHEYETGARYATLFALGNQGLCYPMQKGSRALPCLRLGGCLRRRPCCVLRQLRGARNRKTGT